jgi:hypothetical protein
MSMKTSAAAAMPAPKRSSAATSHSAAFTEERTPSRTAEGFTEYSPVTARSGLPKIRFGTARNQAKGSCHTWNAATTPARTTSAPRMPTAGIASAAAIAPTASMIMETR